MKFNINIKKSVLGSKGSLSGDQPLKQSFRSYKECVLPGRKFRSETISNQKSVLKLDDS